MTSLVLTPSQINSILKITQTIPPNVSKLFLQKKFKEAHDLCLSNLQVIQPAAFNDFAIKDTVDDDDEEHVNTAFDVGRVKWQAVNAFKMLSLLLLRITTENLSSDEKKSVGVIPPEWIFVAESYGENIIPSEIVAVGLLLLLKNKCGKQAKDVVEIHLSSLSDEDFNKIEANEEPYRVNYERIVELYVLHVLPALEEWDAATEFLDLNEILSDEKKDLYMDKLDVIKEQSIQSKARREARRSSRSSSRSTRSTSKSSSMDVSRSRSHSPVKRSSTIPDETIKAREQIKSNDTTTTTTERATAAVAKEIVASPKPIEKKKIPERKDAATSDIDTILEKFTALQKYIVDSYTKNRGWLRFLVTYGISGVIMLIGIYVFIRNRSQGQGKNRKRILESAMALAKMGASAQ